MAADILGQDATAVLAAFARKEFSPAEYVDAVTSRAEQQQSLNTLVGFDPDHLRQSTLRDDLSGPLAGLPLVIKDNINTADLPTSAATKALTGNQTGTDAGAVALLRTAGAIIGAKANMHELAFGITSNNAHTGAVRNPYDPTLIPGGSSGGTAAAIAAGIFPAGLGTDTGGSCRIPAALCGIVGFRPTAGRYPTDGTVPISHTKDTPGPMARSVRDIALLDSILARRAPRESTRALNTVILGVPRADLFTDLDPYVADTIERQLDALSNAGVRLIDVSLGDVRAHSDAFGLPVVLYEVMRDLPIYLTEHAPHVSFEELVANIASPDVADILRAHQGTGAIPEQVYREAINQHRPAIRRIYASVFKENALDALIFPTTPRAASEIGMDQTVPLNARDVPTFPTFIRHTDLASNIGAPAISLPCPVGTGLPVGIELDGRVGHDEPLLEIAALLEDVMTAC